MNFSSSFVLPLVFMVVTLLFMVLAWSYYRMGRAIERKSREVDAAVKNKERLEKELLTGNLELQDHALHFTSLELHDNVGQVISIVRTKLTLAMDVATSEQQRRSIMHESIQQLGKALTDIRNIARSINSDLIEELGIVEAIRKQMSFVRDLFSMDCILEYDSSSELPCLDKMQNIFLFRIVQEAIQNTIVHAFASTLVIIVTVIDERLRISIEDNGKGFDVQEKKSGIGLRSMNDRAKLLNAKLEITSVVGSGTTITITI